MLLYSSKKEFYIKFITFPESDIGKSSFTKRIQKEVRGCINPLMQTDIWMCQMHQFPFNFKASWKHLPFFLTESFCTNCHATFNVKPEAKNLLGWNLSGCIPHKRGKLSMRMLKIWVNSLSLCCWKFASVLHQYASSNDVKQNISWSPA